MYKKYLVVASKADLAGVNITTQLSQFRGNPVLSSMQSKPSFDFYLVEDEIVYTRNLNLEKIREYDFVIFASRHVSEKGGKSLCLHAPGNFRDSNLGGETGKVCPGSGLWQKQCFERLNKNAGKFHLRDFKVTLECTHHGPLIDKPCVFVEIGSTEAEWKNSKAGFVVAKTIAETIEEFEENPYNEIVVGIGGPHYCPNFNKIQLNSNLAISHVIPQYVFPLTEEMVREVVEKTEEDVEFVLLDWKGLGSAEHRQQVLEVLDKLYLKYKKTSEIDK